MHHYAIHNFVALLWHGQAADAREAVRLFTAIRDVDLVELTATQVKRQVGEWLDLGDDDWVSSVDCTEWRSLHYELDARLEGLEGLTPLDIEPLQGLVDAADGGDDGTDSKVLG